MLKGFLLSDIIYCYIMKYLYREYNCVAFMYIMFYREILELICAYFKWSLGTDHGART